MRQSLRGPVSGLVLALLCAGPVAAGEPPAAAATLAEAARALRVGDRVVVTRPSGETLHGRIESSVPLVLSSLSTPGGDPAGAGPASLTLTESDVARLAVLRDDPLWNGALIGLAVGASVVLAADCNSPGCDSVQAAAVPITLALGAGVGALVDRLHRSPVLVYRADAAAGRATLSIAPLLAPARSGLSVTVRWGGFAGERARAARGRRPAPSRDDAAAGPPAPRGR